ncbi:MAG: hypothetical protein QGI83_21130, partial [Candidatus Latescibacteria bacterium]|nr:hypothetical protein [Candidatus Latescibacterota bacterium]
HRRTLGYLKRELAPCEPAEVVDFMVRWQHLHPACRLSGIDGLRAVVRQLQGYEVLSGVLEPDLLRFRVADYGPHLLEQLIASGEVQWLRVGDGVSRGKLTLCLAEDAAWLGRGVESSFDVEAEADADIAGVIQRVRNHFRSRPVGFFDDLVPAAGADEGATLRAVWYLAWCGELTCGTYECLRHASFRSLLSACYDTASTPADIVGGRLSPERVVDRLRERRMDPRLAPWMATDRLLGSAAPLDRTEIVRRWARQLLDRWGVVTRDMVSSEEAAPPWTELEPELKRLELTGVVTRGYFIESHYGVQYGLPDALDLLRDCRSGGAGGSGSPSPREAPFVGLSPRDPANLYVSCLEVMQENGVRLQTPRRRSADRPTVVRSGRPVLHAGHQVETLTRGQLRDCVDALRWTPSGEEARTTFRTWNGRPIDTSPVSDVLWEMGFRFDRPGQMAWPPQRETGDPPRVPRQEILLPHYLEPSPVADEPNPKVAPAPDSDSPVREAVGPNAIAINRTPVLTLWGTVVSQRLGYDWETALTLGRCLSGLNAQTKGRRLGIFAAPKGTDDDSAPRKMGLGEEFWIRICGRSLPARRTVRGVRAVTGDRAIAPRSVENYLKGRFGDRFEDARTRMTELAGSYTPELLDQAAWDLYVRFRPRIPDGIEGWGAQGVLDLDLIRSLARG